MMVMDSFPNLNLHNTDSVNLRGLVFSTSDSSNPDVLLLSKVRNLLIYH